MLLLGKSFALTFSAAAAARKAVVRCGSPISRITLSGGDLAEYKGLPIDHQEAWRLLSTGQDLVTSIEEAGTIVVAKVQGLAHAIDGTVDWTQVWVADA